MVSSALLLTTLLALPAVLASDKSKSTSASNSCSASTVTVTQTVTSTVTSVNPSTPSTSIKSFKDDNKSTASTSASASSITPKVDEKKSSTPTTSSTKSSSSSSAIPTLSSSGTGKSSSTSKSDDKKSTSTSKPSSSVSSKTDDKSRTSTSASSTPPAQATLAVQTGFKPSLSTSFIYDLDNQPIDAPIIKTASGLSLNKTMYVVDMAQSTAEQFANYHAKGKSVGCYFSAGTWEPYRSDAKQFLPECYCGPNVSTDSTGRCTGKGSDANLLGEWGEWWLDIRSEKCLNNIKSIMSDRIKAAKAKGCDSVDPDNVDAWTNQQNFGITKQDQVNYLLWLSSIARSNGLGIDLKNSGDLITDPDTGKSTDWTTSLVNAFDFNVIESCYQYDECEKYDPFLKASKPQIRIEYKSSIKKCPSLKTGQQLLVYSGTVVNSSQITLSCP
ncbi:hypothetical protein I302_100032 [Kwoniella bestiolae CBS 10118]|uniref:alpha-galactosidase n=1 Tax=Kwoniella bestiolae CBS 10118 TaxID=1296100 RepID=A0A1B9G3Z5_9TREE|nr:hypothetical protein I302_03404 [Kwoniella bestiolae CBS 10118]OCF25731.1 hypothetical protein I302_03404 [Kwoniella bestiolae CBS 10118]